MTARRRRLHSGAAEAVEAIHHNQLHLHYDELIHHYERGGEIRKALDYARLAADQALNFSGFHELLHYLNRALELLRALPEPERSETELEVQVSLAHIWGELRGWTVEEVDRSSQRALELCRRTGNDTALMPTLIVVRLSHMFRGEFDRAAEVANEHLAIAQRLGDRYQEAFARCGLTDVMLNLGEFVAAREHVERATAICQYELTFSRQPSKKKTFPRAPVATHNGAQALPSAHDLPDLRAYCSYAVLPALWLLGFADQARKRDAEALLRGEEADAHWLVCALMASARVHLWCGEADAVRDRSERVLTLTNKHGLSPHWSVWVNALLRPWLLIHEGRTPEAIAVLQDQGELANFELAKAYARAGQAEGALAAINGALEFRSKRQQHVLDAELQRVKGEILLMQPQLEQAEAERCFRDAIMIAQRQSAKSWELRATTSLARLLQTQGKTERARHMLADIYNWFTEGFDTADLKEAKALLEQL